MILPEQLANGQPHDAIRIMANENYLRAAIENIPVTFPAPEGFLINGMIVPSVASNNLTVAIKGIDGNDPSATNPIYCRIGGVVRTITAALSFTKNAGTNWCNAGSAELATKEIDYFVYLSWNTSVNTVGLGVSRVPYANLYSDFNQGNAAFEAYCMVDVSHNSTDVFVVIGRFAATLSAGAGYTWTVPTFTSGNLIQKPCYETRWLAWSPVFSGSGLLTYVAAADIAAYKIINRVLFAEFGARGTTGGTTNNYLSITIPFKTFSGAFIAGGGAVVYDGGAFAGTWVTTAGSATLSFAWYDNRNWGIGGTKDIKANLFYKI